MKIKIENYSFDASEKNITFTDYTTIRLDAVLLITNVTDNIIIYNFADATKGGTVAANVLTLTFSTIAMDDADKLLIYYDDNNLSPADETVSITQKTLDLLNDEKERGYSEFGEEITTTDLLAMNMDRGNKLPLQVQLPIDLKQENDGGLILADMKGPYSWTSQTASQPFTIDCTGYLSLLVHKITTGIVTPYTSNDGATFSATLAVAASTTTPAATILTAAGMYIVPVTGKFIRLVGPAANIQCYIYLSRSPCVIFPGLLQTQGVNLANVAGTATVTAGVSGMIAVGGNIAAGTAPTANPVPMGGADDLKAPLTRRLLVDSQGRQIISTQTGQIPGTTINSIPQLNEVGFLSTYKNRLAVQEMGTADGMSELDLLQSILIEMKIMNYQLNELPRLIDEGRGALDCIDDLRKEIKPVLE